jgi:hypothetical protein
LRKWSPCMTHLYLSILNCAAPASWRITVMRRTSSYSLNRIWMQSVMTTAHRTTALQQGLGPAQIGEMRRVRMRYTPLAAERLPCHRRCRGQGGFISSSEHTPGYSFQTTHWDQRTRTSRSSRHPTSSVCLWRAFFAARFVCHTHSQTKCEIKHRHGCTCGGGLPLATALSAIPPIKARTAVS